MPLSGDDHRISGSGGSNRYLDGFAAVDFHRVSRPSLGQGTGSHLLEPAFPDPRDDHFDDIQGSFRARIVRSYDRDIRSQALYWMGVSHERSVGLMSEGNYKGRGKGMGEAYQTYRRVTFDFPDSKWAKYARGRLADPVFARIIELEKLERERMIEQLKESR